MRLLWTFQAATNYKINQDLSIGCEKVNKNPFLKDKSSQPLPASQKCDTASSEDSIEKRTDAVPKNSVEQEVNWTVDEKSAEKIMRILRFDFQVKNARLAKFCRNVIHNLYKYYDRPDKVHEQSVARTTIQ